MPSMDRSTAAEAIVRAAARLGRRGLIAAAEGNLSVRLDDGSLLVTPAGYRTDELELGDLVVVDPAGAVAATRVGLTPTSDLAIHRILYWIPVLFGLIGAALAAVVMTFRRAE